MTKSRIPWTKESVILGCSFAAAYLGVMIRAQKCLDEWTAEAWFGEDHGKMVTFEGCKDKKHAKRMARRLGRFLSREVHGEDYLNIEKRRAWAGLDKVQ